MTNKCPNCSRKHYKEKIIHVKKTDYVIKICLSCKHEYGMEEVSKSTVTNEYFLKGKKDDK
jgi:ribosome-binding protein aMBF1 (putative translation factor)